MTTALTTRPNGLVPVTLPEVSAAAIEQAMTIGDISKMPPAVRVAYYLAACQSAGLNPLSRPFDVLKAMDGTMRLYANKDAAEQLRKRDRVSIRIISREHDTENRVYTVVVQASTPDGRCDEAMAVVPTAQLSGQQLANAIMKSETKAKRRVTLSLCGLGFPMAEDESADRAVAFDPVTGEIRGETPASALLSASRGKQGILDAFGEEPTPNVPPPTRGHPVDTDEQPDADGQYTWETE